MDWKIQFESDSAKLRADADEAFANADIPADVDGFLEPAVKSVIGVVPTLAASLERGGSKSFDVELAGDAESVSVSVRVVGDQSVAAEVPTAPAARPEELARQRDEAIVAAERLGQLEQAGDEELAKGLDKSGLERLVQIRKEGLQKIRAIAERVND